MTLLLFAEKFAGPVATVLAASVVATFAALQWRTARLQAQIALNKLKLDTFRDRNDVYEATRELMRIALNIKTQPYDRIKENIDCRTRIRRGVFYYNDETMITLEDIIDKAHRIEIAKQYIGKENIPTYEQFMNEYRELRIEITNKLENLAAVFEPFLYFDILKDEKAPRVDLDSHQGRGRLKNPN